MFSRFVRNQYRPGLMPELIIVTFILTLTAFGAVTICPPDAQAARNVNWVDGHGMANGEDTRGGGGNVPIAGDPWGGEQRDSDPVEDDGPEIQTHVTTSYDAPRTIWTLEEFWSRFMTFWASFFR